jgi:hypothetical protein
VFPARYELNSYIVYRKRLVSKRLKESTGISEDIVSIEGCFYQNVNELKLCLTFAVM